MLKAANETSCIALSRKMKRFHKPGKNRPSCNSRFFCFDGRIVFGGIAAAGNERLPGTGRVHFNLCRSNKALAISDKHYVRLQFVHDLAPHGRLVRIELHRAGEQESDLVHSLQNANVLTRLVMFGRQSADSRPLGGLFVAKLETRYFGEAADGLNSF